MVSKWYHMLGKQEESVSVEGESVLPSRQSLFVADCYYLRSRSRQRQLCISFEGSLTFLAAKEGAMLQMRIHCVHKLGASVIGSRPESMSSSVSSGKTSVYNEG